MLAPQLGYGAFVLLLSPDHTGTEVPLLLGWLVLDLAPRRWWVPVFLGLLLAWTQVGDRVTLLTAVVPLVVVCLARACRVRDERWFNVALAAAGVASVAAAQAAETLLTRAGWFTVYPLNLTLAPARLLWTHTWLTGWGILELFGANFIGVSGWPRTFFAIVHVAGLALAIAGFALALWRFLRLRADLDLVDSVLAVAIVCNLLSYVISTDPGTILRHRVRRPGDRRRAAARGRAGRPAARAEARAAQAPRLRSGYVALGLLACYGAALGYGAAQAAAPGDNADLAGWLAAHHLRYGLGRAESNVVTVDSGGSVHLAVVADRGGRVRPQLYQSAAVVVRPAAALRELPRRQYPAGDARVRAGPDRGRGRAPYVRAAGADLSIRRLYGHGLGCEPAHATTVIVPATWNGRRERLQCSQSHMLEGCPDAAC